MEEERGAGAGDMVGVGRRAGDEHGRLKDLSLSPIFSRGARSGGQSVLTEGGSQRWGGRQAASPLMSRDEWLLQVALNSALKHDVMPLEARTMPPYARQLSPPRPLPPIYLSI